MAQVVAHKTLRNAAIGLGGKPYRVDGKGVLTPQPQGEERKQILLLRALTLIDDDALSGIHPGLIPKVPEVEDVPAPRPTAAEVMALTRALDGVAPAEGVMPVLRPELPPMPDDPDPEDQYLDALSRDDLLEVARSRGLPGLKGKTKAQLLTLVKGG